MRKFVRSPWNQMGEPYTSEVQFRWDLIRYCAEASSASVVSSQRLARAAMTLFLTRDPRDATETEAACLVRSAKGVLAMGDYLLEHYTDAERTLANWELGDGCPCCRASRLRILGRVGLGRAYHYKDVEAGRRAMERLSEAVKIHLDGGFDDHDLSGNGLANCLLARASGYGVAGRWVAALEDNRRAILLLDPKESKVLYRNALSDLAVNLVASNCEKDWALAAETLTNARRLFAKSRKPTLERARLRWVEGLVCGRQHPGAPEAVEDLEDARDDFMAVHAINDAVAVAADLQRLSLPNLALVRDHLEYFADRRNNRRDGLAVFHDWLPSKLSDGLRRVEKLLLVQAATTYDEPALLKAIEALRELTEPRIVCVLQ